MIKLDDEKIKIEGLVLPTEIQISISNRNRGGLNHVFEDNEIKILCSKCKEYHPVFKLFKGKWEDVNKTYWQSKSKKDNQSYFGSKCTACYKNKNTQIEQQKNVYQQRIMEYEQTVTRKSGGIPHSVVLSPELDMYLKLYCVTNKVKKNKLINILLEEFKQAHPLNLP